jgi:hypothetical protein
LQRFSGDLFECLEEEQTIPDTPENEDAKQSQANKETITTNDPSSTSDPQDTTPNQPSTVPVTSPPWASPKNPIVTNPYLF